MNFLVYWFPMDYLTEYNPEWPAWFAQIEMYLRARISPLLRIEHVGSTSIVGMFAKPIIDIDIVVGDSQILEVVASIERAGYTHRGDLGVIGREAFGPESPETITLPPHHLYACEASANALLMHLSFRDYLRSHPDESELLANYKRCLINEEKLSREEYVQAKSESDLVSRLSERAAAWRIGNDK